MPPATVPIQGGHAHYWVSDSGNHRHGTWGTYKLSLREFLLVQDEDRPRYHRSTDTSALNVVTVGKRAVVEVRQMNDGTSTINVMPL